MNLGKEQSLIILRFVEKGDNMKDHGQNPPNSCDIQPLTRCHNTIQLLEDQLLEKNRELMNQVGYNSMTLIIGMVVGFLFAKIWAKKTK